MRFIFDMGNSHNQYLLSEALKAHTELYVKNERRLDIAKLTCRDDLRVLGLNKKNKLLWLSYFLNDLRLEPVYTLADYIGLLSLYRNLDERIDRVLNGINVFDKSIDVNTKKLFLSS